MIGQAAEFDYSGTQALCALREEGYRLVLVNSNPATIMTDPELSDATYIEPMTLDVAAAILEKERPDALLPTVGGQTALNLALQLQHEGILKKLGVELIGADIDAILKAEDRSLFKTTMAKAGLDVLHSAVCHSLKEAFAFSKQHGFPVVIRPSFTLGGSGGGIAYGVQDLDRIVSQGLLLSPTHQVLVEESVLGWKEYELEVVRDHKDNVIVVCGIENVDPMGVHTGDSMTVAPIQTLTDREYQQMRSAAILVLRAIGVRTGGSNVQFAVHPQTGRQVVIEMNPRVSRSSALASKATGYPIAQIAAKLAVGYTLDELPNQITNKTKAAFEPSMDYVAVKIPRFAFEKFHGTSGKLTTQMQSVGEVMAFGRNWKEALQKAICSLEIGAFGLEKEGISDLHKGLSLEEGLKQLQHPTPDRLWRIAEVFRHGACVEAVHGATCIDPWFLEHIRQIVHLEAEIQNQCMDGASHHDMLRWKQNGFSDIRLAQLLQVDAHALRKKRQDLGVFPVFKRVDSCAGEFEAQTPYLYSTYEKAWITQHGNKTVACEAEASKHQKVLVVGGGPIRIGQGIEFDYCCVQALQAFREQGLETLMVNCNPETVSTDWNRPNKLYFEPVTFEHVMNIVDQEKPNGVVLQLGGQTPLKLAKDLHRFGIPLWGTSVEAIEQAEDRTLTKQLLDRLGLLTPPSYFAVNVEQAFEKAIQLGFPLILRPSFVLGGRGMEIVFSKEDLNRYLQTAIKASESHPLLLERFLENATEIDVDLVCDGTDVVIGAVMQQIERAGVHSGDSACMIPALSFSDAMIDRIVEISKNIALSLPVQGLMNLQLAIQDDALYVLEINPRASRTVPFVSKASCIPLVQMASLVMIGKKLKAFSAKLPPLYPKAYPYVAVKEAVMPFSKFIQTDSILGPEMRSTGEVMGLDSLPEQAFLKSQLGAGMRLPLLGTVFVSIADPDKPIALPAIRRMQECGFLILATRGTNTFLSTHGIESTSINKVREGNPHILDAIQNGEVDIIFNTILGPKSMYDSYLFRQKALEYSIPYYTTVESAMAVSEAIQSRVQGASPQIRSLQEYKAMWFNKQSCDPFYIEDLQSSASMTSKIRG